MPKPKPIRPPKPHQRAWREGTVREVRLGVWRAWRARAHKLDGTSSRPSRTFTGDEAEARAKLWARGDVQPAQILLGYWLDRWLALVTPTLEPSTVRLYRRAVAACSPLAGRPLAAISVDEWQGLTNELLGRWARSTVAAWRGMISIALRTAIPEHLTANPLARVRLPKAGEQIVRAWRQDEVDRLLTAAAGHHHEPWLVFSLGTGVRIGEARALLWEDVDLREKTATIRASLSSQTGRRGPTKTKRVRVIDLPDEVAEVLAAHRKRQAAGVTHVFGRGRGVFWPAAFAAWLKRICVRAKVRPLPPHSLRHTCASLALDAGVPVQDVARQLGHSVKTCQTTYSHYIGDGQRRAAKALGKAIRHRLSGPKRAARADIGT